MRKKSLSFEPPVELNSIWLEGTVLEEPTDVSDRERPACRFEVATSRWHLQEQDLSVFTVEVREPQLAACRKQLTKGRGVRIIGRLHQNRWKDLSGNSHTDLQIVGELVQTRPLFAATE
jgi:single-strand DNA-binding protein